MINLKRQDPLTSCVFLQLPLNCVTSKVIIVEVFRALQQQYGNRIKLYNPNSISPKVSESELIELIETVIKLNETASNNADYQI